LTEVFRTLYRGCPIALMVVGCLLGSSFTHRAGAEERTEQPVLMDFNGPLQFDYGSFKGKTRSEGGRLIIQAKKDAGGGGTNLTLNLAAWKDHSPALTLMLGEDHNAPRLRVMFADEQKNSAEFQFTLKGLAAGKEHRVLPRHAASLAEPNKQKLRGEAEAVDWSKIAQIQIQGSWKGEPVDVALERLSLTPPTPEMEKQREAERRRRAKAREAARRKAEELERKRRELLANMTHPADGPKVVHLGAVAPDMLAVTIEAGDVIHKGQQPYEKQDGDRIKRQGPRAIMWEDGEIVQAKRDLELVRRMGENKAWAIGHLAHEAGMLHPNEGFEGRPITELTVDAPEAYRVVSASDARFAEPITPIAVHRKSKLIDRQQSTGANDPAMGHVLFLKLPEALREGAEYEVRFVGVNAAREAVTYRHAPRETRSIAVHVNQVGYRPDDPYKRALLSIWLGTGGAHAYDTENLRFHLLDDRTGESVYQGPVEPAQAADQTSRMRGGYNHNQTHVYRMNFADFDQPGRYRVYVEGIGCSYPFEIAADVWERAFRTSMMGLLHHRSGLELGPPFTEYRRPRGFHPDDGVKLYQTDRPTGEVAAIISFFKQDLEDGTLDAPLAPEAWGGYMDAGDWDRNQKHLGVSYLHLELLELFPDYFRDVKLDLPPAEAANDRPDLLDEAMWNIAFFKRLQTEAGGVRSGVESTSHPRAGEASWQESLLIGVFSEQPLASYRFAAVAAKLARIVADSHPDLSAEYRPAALAAWDWAEANRDPNLNGRDLRELQTARTTALVELYWLTGEAKYHDAFKRFAADNEAMLDGQATRYQAALFTYARMPAEKADADLQQRSREALVDLARTAADFAATNAWGIALDIPDIPVMGYVGYLTTPGAVSRSVVRAHYLTGDEDLLAVAVGQTNFTLGANPDNTVYTTGLGHSPIRHPLHIDSRVTGQPAPAGITVYGPSDPRAGFAFESWVHTWVIGKHTVPNSRTWPATEAYHDIYKWPSTCEYTVHQTIGPTGYHWAYLAARGR